MFFILPVSSCNKFFGVLYKYSKDFMEVGSSAGYSYIIRRNFPANGAPDEHQFSQGYNRPYEWGGDRDIDFSHIL